MDLVAQLSSLFGKENTYAAEYKRFKASIARNPRDSALKAQFINFCLLNRFMKHEIKEEHITEALQLFETIDQRDAFDLQCQYLVGKYYQEEKDTRKAYRIYLEAIKNFNRHVTKNPSLKSENSELAYSIALNVMTLQSNPVDPELKQCFTILRKSYPLHLKSIELENEMAKPAPDPARIKELKDEIRRLKEDEEVDPSESKPKEQAAQISSPTAAPPQPAKKASANEPLPIAKKEPAAEPAREEKKAPLAKPTQEAIKTPPAEPIQAAKEPSVREPLPVITKLPRSESAAASIEAPVSEPIPAAKKSPGSEPTQVAKETPAAKKKEEQVVAKTSFTAKKKDTQTIELSPGDGENLDFLKFSPTLDKTSQESFFMVYTNNSWEGPYTPLQLSSKGFLKPGTWVCRAGSQHVTQAYEVPDLLLLFK
jgi:tetratricopeptide (TPR) repeat protein